jgi:DNA-binding NarL/FixJ family response regulator
MSAHSRQAFINRSNFPTAERGGRRLRIVVADDSPTFLEVICALLELDEEVDVIARVENGLGALEVVADLQPDLVLMDVEMPHLDGLTAAMLIAERSPLTTIVLMSSEDSPELRMDCRAFGADRFIYKPDLRNEFPIVLENVKQALQGGN